MILIVTNERDLTTDFVVRELQRRERSYHRLNTNSLARTTFALDPLSRDCVFETERGTLGIGEVKAAYFRRPELPDLGIVDGQIAYAATEWSALLKSIYLIVGDRWLSHPRDIYIAEDKPSQLFLANQLGFHVPETIVTNDLDGARDFSARGRTVAKPHRQALVEIDGVEHVMFTSNVEHLGDADREAVRAAPVIFQRLIPKTYDVRVTVVGSQVFAVAIHSQDTNETALDWRRGSNPTLIHEVITLPERVSAACVEFVRRQKLRFGAIDLVFDVDGVFWFLECNPNGQWAWIENRTGLPIAAAIVDELERIAAR